jgi:1,4-dihydroxy-2-naphthoyl-CoA hydrolase
LAASGGADPSTPVEHPVSEFVGNRESAAAGGAGGFGAVKDRGQQAVGVSNATDFVRPHRSARLHVLADPIQQGRTQQLWQIEIRRPEDDQLVARGQVRLQNIAVSR